MEHVRYKCDDQCSGCFACDGGLFSCTVCGGAEASLPTHCPGRMMTDDEAADVVTGVADFKDGAWTR